MRGSLSFAVALSIVGLFPSLSQAQSAAAPTYSKDIAPIFFAQCTSCHRAGEQACQGARPIKACQAGLPMAAQSRLPH